MAQDLRSTTVEWDLMKQKFCKAEDGIISTTRQHTDWEKFFTNSTSFWRLISKIYKELNKSVFKNPNNLI